MARASIRPQVTSSSHGSDRVARHEACSGVGQKHHMRAVVVREASHDMRLAGARSGVSGDAGRS